MVLEKIPDWLTSLIQCRSTRGKGPWSCVGRQRNTPRGILSHDNTRNLYLPTESTCKTGAGLARRSSPRVGWLTFAPVRRNCSIHGQLACVVELLRAFSWHLPSGRVPRCGAPYTTAEQANSLVALFSEE